MDKKALGRGLSALIPEREEASGAEKLTYLKLEQIRPSPLQPREKFDAEGLQELTQSIKEKGLIQPILVRQKGDHYELIAGERRFRAAGLLNLKEIPALVRQAGDEDSLEISLIENIQREDLNPIEEARAYQYLLDKFNLTQERLSEVLGKARVTITNVLRLLKLPQEIQEEIKQGRISYAHGRVLLELDDPNQQRRLSQETIAGGLSVRELENLIKSYRRRGMKRRIDPSTREPQLAVLEEELQQILATKIRISKRRKRGHILIEFYSEEDLGRIITIIRGRREENV
ncbi:MAG: ParB/RepB/Spo0J family partition protein [Candidatus Omnitrophica bacterium]|nr:ParB/RepB/Spo0J family partition protein [Candidatus Omnitrophota bacterium]